LGVASAHCYDAANFELEQELGDLPLLDLSNSEEHQGSESTKRERSADWKNSAPELSTVATGTTVFVLALAATLLSADLTALSSIELTARMQDYMSYLAFKPVSA
jgi:glycerol-3-phosphate O-acyltransferase